MSIVLVDKLSISRNLLKIVVVLSPMGRVTLSVLEQDMKVKKMTRMSIINSKAREILHIINQLYV